MGTRNSLFMAGLLPPSGGDHREGACVAYWEEELSRATMDQGRPHQVALPAYRCLGHNYLTIRFFCEGERLSLRAPCHSYRENDMDMTVFGFAGRAHVEQIRE